MAEGDAESLGIEVWRGGVNTWECDEMGHMNVRFYLARVMEGMVGVAAALGMPQAFAADAGASLLLREQHIRFLREARAGAPLHMRAAVVDIDETEARVLQVLFHSATGEPAATFVSRFSHVTAGGARPFAWPGQTRERAAALTLAMPAYAAPRSIDTGPFESRASLERARALGVRSIAAGAIAPQDCDAFGRMRAEQFIGRVSDGIQQLSSEIHKIVASTAEAHPQRIGGAVLEYRLVHLDWPRAGERVVVHSGLAGVDARIQRMAHWMLDPETGKAWAAAVSIATTLNLDTRKMVPISPAAIERLSALTISELDL